MDDWLQAEAELLAAIAKPSQERANGDEPRGDDPPEDNASRTAPAPAARRGRDNGTSRRTPRQPHSH